MTETGSYATPFVLLRHGPTEWNRDRRLQGRSDIPLSRKGRAEVASWHLPPDLQDYNWLVSPLERARETARILGLEQARIEPRLIEMNWGEWEGQRIADLRLALGTAMTRNEAKGLDFQPPDGESPRDLQERLKPLLEEIGQERRPTAAVCHRGVIRALYALASGWDMTGKPPDRLKEACLHRFAISNEGIPAVVRMNESLRGGEVRI
ncbi:histidine phosphatase family protein [Limibacillus halophilus]|uniref:Putative phosphoglycerate mutase n=1 Tax=Limibacillus halophilus TaxID=1579333 RepID=A0A839SM52_9PROT|nr:histidine phosphatase family protein [Limibacillus halophilus]MBB3063901.1 putative phosphoglycerate mutase [Limibacillus halophilus]